MNEHPILFSTPMVKAILEGRKTQTRRVIKPQPTRMAYAGGVFSNGAIGFVGDEGKSFVCPYGIPGDHLWVRETWAGDENTGFAYKASEPDALPFGEECIFDKWKPSIHMPRVASRITLEIANIRVERVQEISRDDAILEGLYSFTSNLGAKNSSPVRFYCANKGDDGGYMNPVEAFENLWDSINEKRGFGWSTNPWVWVVEFKRLH